MRMYVPYEVDKSRVYVSQGPITVGAEMPANDNDDINLNSLWKIAK
jgi:hypothetical protein